MDDDQFDALVRAGLQPASRRAAAVGLLVGALGAAGLILPNAAEGHDPLTRCKNIPDKKKRAKCVKEGKKHREWHKANACRQVGNACKFGDCCSGLTCDVASGYRCVQPPPSFAAPMRGNMQVMGFAPGVGDHTGRDYYAVDFFSDNSAVYPTAAGKVVYTGWNCDTVSDQPPCYGNTVCLDHGAGYYSIYTHLAATGLPALNTQVGVNTRIGTMSNTGCSGCGIHLHFAVHRGTPGLQGSDSLWNGSLQAVKTPWR